MNQVLSPNYLHLKSIWCFNWPVLRFSFLSEKEESFSIRVRILVLRLYSEAKIFRVSVENPGSGQYFASAEIHWAISLERIFI